MASFNKVILMGNLTRDPELRYTASNMAICKVGMAVNRRVKDQQTDQWREEATFVDVTIFGKRGEAFDKFHKKGASAFIDGELRFDQWEDKESGQKRSKLYVVANNWEFVGGGREAGAGGGGGGGRDGGFDGGYGGQQAQPQQQPAAAGGGYGGDGGGGGGYGGGGGGGGGGGQSQGGDSGAAFLGDDDTPF
ncbi:single-stranded DNA-binding protein [Planctomycetota bacterium]|nr:single-stranded DNA-binding protein [Planctomycetota bacterium]